MVRYICMCFFFYLNVRFSSVEMRSRMLPFLCVGLVTCWFKISYVIAPTWQPLNFTANCFNVLYSIYTHLYTELYLIFLIIYTGFREYLLSCHFNSV